MWHEYLKERYSKETFQKFLEWIADKSSQQTTNNVTGKIDWYYPGNSVWTFECTQNVPEIERIYPQK